MNDEVRTRLQELIATYGTALADDPRLVEALLRDVVPHDTLEIFVLVSALRAQLVPEARQWHGSLPPEVLARRLTARLQRELGLAEEAARWSVESWLLALGIPLPQQPVVLVGLRGERADTLYERVGRSLWWAGPYPRDNACARCGQVADRKLVPWPGGWLCDQCTRYERLRPSLWAGPYPRDNACARCGQVADRKLVSWLGRWLCDQCLHLVLRLSKS